MNILRRIKKKIIVVIVNTIFAGTHFFKIKRVLLNCCEGTQIGNNTKIVTPIILPEISELKIGNDCWIGRHFALEGNGSVSIGNNCDLGPNVTCVTGSHEVGDEIRRAGKGYNGIIKIGNGTWIGTKTVILPNTNVGNSLIIGSGSVVTKNLIDDAVYAGNPARLIRNL